ncbi:divergent polysaccharide deacetylase family protein [Bermanella sp. R86510]|uniref:divergent polysaccharide deacetylase family protein n=1 Tax=unclassified Bermanella TaxID=2627862 RepID=UPI0037C585EB
MMKAIWILTCLVCSNLLCELAIANSPNIVSQPISSPARIAIIIDDIGNSLTRGLDAIALPGNITFAVMPHRKHSKTLAERAGRLGKEVILHAPMSNINKQTLGAGALYAELGEDTFKRRLLFSIDNTPYIRGINNHMGSQLTTSSQAMDWVMDVLKDKKLFFVDSRTHANSVAFERAQFHGLASAKRDVFLDHERTVSAIHKQFKLTVSIAQKYGSAIAIGHPYPETLTYLQHVLPQLAQHNIETIYVSALLQQGMSGRPQNASYDYYQPQPALDALFESLGVNN